MADPRFSGQADQKLVVKNPGWFAMEHINELSGGSSYTDDMPGRANDSRWLEFYATTAEIVQSPHLARFYLKMNGTAQDSMEGSAVRAEMYDDVTGKVMSAQAVHAETKMGTNTTGVVGYLAALRGILTLDADSKTLSGGVYAAAFLTMNIGTGITAANRTSFIAFEDSGKVAANFLFDTESIASASDGVWETDSGAVGGTVLGYYKVQTAAGSGYLVVYANHS